jgi:hypothetical protein
VVNVDQPFGVDRSLVVPMLTLALYPTMMTTIRMSMLVRLF